jgi:hypothetical protein
MKVKDCNEYIVNVGLLMRYSLLKVKYICLRKCRSYKMILQLSDYQKGLHLQMFSLWVLTINGTVYTGCKT